MHSIPDLYIILLGPSTNDTSFRHYVAFIRKKIPGKDVSWVLYNDEEVVQANDVQEMKKYAYVYFFQRA